jgi:hypothetical protein
MINNSYDWGLRFGALTSFVEALCITLVESSFSSPTVLLYLVVFVPIVTLVGGLAGGFFLAGRHPRSSQQATDRSLSIELFPLGKHAFPRCNSSVRVVARWRYAPSVAEPAGGIFAVARRASARRDSRLPCWSESGLGREQAPSDGK